jgi:hypothetical protein
MSTRKMVLPDEMIDRVTSCGLVDTKRISRSDAIIVLASAFSWLSENPIVPTDEQWALLLDWDSQISSFDTFFRHVLAEWQRRMFLAPELEVPEEVKDLWQSSPTPDTKRRTLEAYRRGQKSRL